MKALVLSVVIAMSSVVNAANSNTLAGFAYNSEVNQQQVASKTIFKVENQKYLHRHLQYNYAYDAQGRISQKEVLKWNEGTQAFEKHHCLNLSYSQHEVSIEYATWNVQKQTYSDIKSKAIYQISQEGEAINYQSYEWNKKENDWNLVTEHTTLHNNEVLFAENSGL